MGTRSRSRGSREHGGRRGEPAALLGAPGAGRGSRVLVTRRCGRSTNRRGGTRRSTSADSAARSDSPSSRAQTGRGSPARGSASRSQRATAVRDDPKKVRFGLWGCVWSVRGCASETAAQRAGRRWWGSASATSQKRELPTRPAVPDGLREELAASAVILNRRTTARLGLSPDGVCSLGSKSRREKPLRRNWGAAMGGDQVRGSGSRAGKGCERGEKAGEFEVLDLGIHDETLKSLDLREIERAGGRSRRRDDPEHRHLSVYMGLLALRLLRWPGSELLKLAQ